MKLSSWGNLTNSNHHIEFLQSLEAKIQLTENLSKLCLPYGMGKSYGDVCLNPDGKILNTTMMDQFILFDDYTGELTCEAGVLLKHIHEIVIPRGWMLPVTPGTQLITVGGAIANDIHGKNHHYYGTFGESIIEITLARTSGELLTCNRNTNEDWLKATIGGIGLTGLILTAKIQLRPVSSALLLTQSVSFYGLQEFITLARNSEKKWEYTVAWIDCLSGKHTKGVFMSANHLQKNQPPLESIQATAFSWPKLPISLVNTLTLKTFNNLFYLKNKYTSQRLQHFESFQYPLDNMLNWNRLYGKKGFYQYQFVIPKYQGIEPLEEILKIIQRHQQGSFLVVLKEFSDRVAQGLLSFPMEGLTLALDFPNLGQKTLDLMDELDNIVYQAHGRLYLAKDARMSSKFFRQSYSNVDIFLKYRDSGISSAMSKRLLGY